MNLVQLVPHGSSTAMSPHRSSALLTCGRLWLMRYHRRIRPVHDKKFRMLGTLAHMVMAWYWAGRMVPRPDWYVQVSEGLGPTALKQVLDHFGAGFPDEIHTAMSFERYVRSAYADSPWAPVSIEEEIQATLGELRRNHDPACEAWPEDDAVISCRIDMLARSNGQLILIDWKSSGKAWGGGDRLVRWKDDNEFALHQQMMIDMHLVQHRYGPVRSCVIGRVKRVLPFDHDAEPIPIPRLAYGEVLSMLAEAVRAERRHLTTLEKGGKVSPSFAACFGRWGACDYRDLCRAGSNAERRAVMDVDFAVDKTGYMMEEAAEET